ncbi:MAG: glycosyltransferase family 4 protein [Candidatus Brocadiaceae bacterium]|nr:glycosyltransferase family 4 protein [Candidatus Brocadiaceae bacterium]
MRILHIDTERTWRGGEQQLLYLVKGLKEREHTSSVICQPGSSLEDAVKKAEIDAIPIKMRSEIDILAAWKIGRFLRRGKYDILHAHTSHAHSIGLLARFFGKVKAMAVSRRVDFPIRSRFKYNSFAVHYIAVSEAIKRVMAEGGISPQKIDVVRSCIDLDRLDNAVISDVRAEFGIGKDIIIIGNIAHMADHKGQIYLIRAANIIKNKYQNIKFIIVGDGELRSRLELEAHKLGLNDILIFTGFRKDVISILASFDIFAFPSHLEGLGTSLLDAMAMRQPIVSTTAGGIPEAVKNGINGILVPPKDPESFAKALIYLIERPELRSMYGNIGRKLVEGKFTTDKMIEGTLNVYKKLLS